MAVLVEGVGDVLFRRDAADVFALQLLDQLQGIQGDGVQGSHHAAILHGPIRADEGQEVGEFGDRETEVAL